MLTIVALFRLNCAAAARPTIRGLLAQRLTPRGLLLGRRRFGDLDRDTGARQVRPTLARAQKDHAVDA